MPAGMPNSRRKQAQVVDLRKPKASPEARARMLAAAERELSAYKARVAFDKGDFKTFVSISLKHDQLPAARLALQAVMVKGFTRQGPSFIARNRKQLMNSIALIQTADQKAAEELMRLLRRLESGD